MKSQIGLVVGLALISRHVSRHLAISWVVCCSSSHTVCLCPKAVTQKQSKLGLENLILHHQCVLEDPCGEIKSQ